MKLEIDIPEWAKEKNIYVFANEELIAYKWHHEDKVHHKIARCNGCGQCCESGSPFNGDEGPCIFLKEHGCDLGTKIPLTCARSICYPTFDKCSERFD